MESTLLQISGILILVFWVVGLTRYRNLKRKKVTRYLIVAVAIRDYYGMRRGNERHEIDQMDLHKFLKIIETKKISPPL